MVFGEILQHWTLPPCGLEAKRFSIVTEQRCTNQRLGAAGSVYYQSDILDVLGPLRARAIFTPRSTSDAEVFLLNHVCVMTLYV